MRRSGKRFFLIPLVVMMSMLLAACGTEVELDLSDPAAPAITQRTYYTEEDLAKDSGEFYGQEEPSGKTLEEALYEDDPDLEMFEETRNGVKYKYTIDSHCVKNTEDASPYAYIDTRTQEEVYMADSRIIFSGKKKAELYNYTHYMTDSSASDTSLDDTIDFYDLKVTLPFKVYYTNGTKTGSKTVLFDKSFAESEERCVAVSTKARYDITEITVKMEKIVTDFDGNKLVYSTKTCKNGKTYKRGDRISISSKNAIKVFTINGVNVSENHYMFTEEGTYKIRIVLANDTTKELKIKIK